MQGPCRAFIDSWFFNPGTGKCERFVYGGCGGNANRFATRQDCENRCGTRGDDRRNSILL